MPILLSSRQSWQCRRVGDGADLLAALTLADDAGSR
jgi:hypothetical protein